MGMEMVLLIALMFTFTLSLTGVGYLLSRPRRIAMERLQSLPAPEMTPLSPEAALASPVKPLDERTLGALRKKNVKAPISMGDATQTQRLLHYAGYRSGSALATYSLVRLAFIIALPGIFLAATWRLPMRPPVRFLGIALTALTGFVIPKLVLRMKARRRQHRLRLSLPDALDLLVVCVEAGMGLNQAIVKVAEELQETHAEISEELKLVNLEIRAGRSRGEALRNLGERTGVDDIISLAAMLIQTDKFGTSIARSLRVHSDALRTERIQRAEEAAAKTTIKLIFPLLFCVFPALLVVILGPAFLNLARIFSQTVLPATQ